MRATAHYMPRFAIVLLLGACADDALPTSPSMSATALGSSRPMVALAAVHSVTGAGLSPSVGSGEFAWSISAHLDAAGNARGTLIGRPDLTVYGLGIPTIIGEITCLDVDGNTAWFEATLTKGDRAGDVARRFRPCHRLGAGQRPRLERRGLLDVGPRSFRRHVPRTSQWPGLPLVRGNFVVR